MQGLEILKMLLNSMETGYRVFILIISTSQRT